MTGLGCVQHLMALCAFLQLYSLVPVFLNGLLYVLTGAAPCNDAWCAAKCQLNWTVLRCVK